MRVAIVGAGSIGQHVGRLFAEAGHEILVSWASSPQRLKRAAEQIGLGAKPVSPAAAVAQADAVLFAPRFEHAGVASDAVGDFAGRVVIDTTNPYNPERDGVLDLAGRTAAEVVSARLPGARYVKGFNTLTAEFLTTSAGREGRDRVVGFLSGDDQDAKTVAAGLVRDAGFDPVDLGGVRESGAQEPGGAYYGEEFHLDDVPHLRRL